MTKNSGLDIYGLIGYPVKHSLSSAMHNAAFEALNINAEYRLFEVEPEKLEDFLLKPDKIFKDTKGNSIRAGDILGFNITVPYKVRALEIASLIKNAVPRQYSEVVLSGAINTVKRENGKLHYRNTDTVGFMKSLREDLKFNSANKNIFIFGCGGAGRAIIAGLICKGAGIKKIFIYDLNKDAIDSAQKHFSKLSAWIEGELEFISLEQIPEKVKDCALLINASPLGMKEGDGSVINKDLLHVNLSVYDVVYNRQTQLIKDAKSAGLNAVNGLGMLLYQGLKAFELWTGKKAPVEVMRKALLEAIKQ